MGFVWWDAVVVWPNARNKLSSSSADRTTSPIYFHTPYNGTHILKHERRNHVPAYTPHCMLSCRNKATRECSNMENIIHFFPLSMQHSVVSRCPQNMFCSLYQSERESECVWVLRMHELRIQSNYVHYLMACIHLGQFQFGESFTAVNTFPLLRETKRSPFRNSSSENRRAYCNGHLNSNTQFIQNSM